MGALTSKPYAFGSRPWELKNMESIDIFDSYISSVRYDYRGVQILRVLPAIDTSTNMEWITDRVRFYYDAIRTQRIVIPWVKGALLANFLKQYNTNINYFYDSAFLFNCSWVFALEVLKFNSYFFKENDSVLLRNFFDCTEGLKSVYVLKQLSSHSGFDNFRTSSLVNRKSFKFSHFLLEKVNACVLIGLNLRYDLPLLNLRLREKVNNNTVCVFNLGSLYNFNYNVVNLGNASSKLYELINGKHFILPQLINFGKIICLVGNRLNNELLKINYLFETIKKYVNIEFCKIYEKPAQLLSSEFGVELDYISSMLTSDIIYNLNNFDDIDFDEEFLNCNSFLGVPNKLIIYSGSHGDINAELADFVFPASMNTEHNEFYLNLDLKLRLSRLIIAPTFLNMRTIFSISKMLMYVLPLKFRNINNRLLNLYIGSKIPDFEEVYSLMINDFEIVLSESNTSNAYLSNSVTRASEFLTLAYATYNSRYSNFRFENV
jgi:NADH dehydrogenase/NADH:ubiquinone oxidoreductase subunit G